MYFCILIQDKSNKFVENSEEESQGNFEKGNGATGNTFWKCVDLLCFKNELFTIFGVYLYTYGESFRAPQADQDN